MSKKLLNDEFIEKAIQKHGDKYDYSKVEYVNAKTKVSIICNSIDEITGEKHNEFWQLPYSHLKGFNCPKCKGQMNQELFIKRARVIHNNKYDYSKVEYVKAKSQVCIICNNIDEITGEKHNEFWQTPSIHLRGANCPKCTGHFMDQELFIKRAIVIHNNKYDYSKVEYKNAKLDVIIICHKTYPWGEEHGEFLQTPDTHLRSKGCPKCSKVFKPNTNEWIKSAEWVHGKRYDYSKVVYKNNRTKICIICKEHREFWQTPSTHLKGANCPKCSGHFMDQGFFLDKAKGIHKDKSGNPLYDYSLVNYKDSSTHVTIICPLHNYEFRKTPNKHLNGQGCPLCGNASGGLKNRLSHEEFLKRAFPDKYEYLTKYDTAKTKINIKCKECGHKFLQEAFSHLSGCGCPRCNDSKLEKEVTKYLEGLDINHEKQKKFKWLGRQSLDFYITDYNIAIECQGIQHFEPKDFFGGKVEFKKQVERDKRKLKKCLSNNMEMIYVVDNEKYLKNEFQFNTVEPFSGNVVFKIWHINNFSKFINHLIARKITLP